jgi:hypothetical protein
MIMIYLVTAAVSVVIMTGAWILAPVHDRPRDDLLPLASYRSVVVYCLAFWIYLVWGLTMMAWTCLARRRTFRREDLARSVSLLLIGVSSAAAVPVVLLWTASILLQHATGREASRLNALGDALMPWPVLVNATGVLSLLTVPYISSLVIASRRWRQLRPLWMALITRYPQVHLDLPPAGGPLARMQTRTERAIIEIHDALRIAKINVAAPSSANISIETVASALRRSDVGERRVADLLGRVDTREADVSQVVALARAYRAASP